MNKTAHDLGGGLSPDHDLVLPGLPDNPQLRESVSIWLFEEHGAFAFPRIGVEAEASCWHDRLFQANFAFADGRVLNGAGRGAPPSALGEDGVPRVIGAGAVTFACVEPFKRWTARFDGSAIDGHVSQQISNTLDPQQRSPVRMDMEMTMVTPAWVQDTTPETVAQLSQDKAADAGFMGIGYRFEHLFRAQGTLRIDEQTREFRGSGLRIHRQSVRPLAGFRGHCWQSALFPDGRAFGYIAYPPHEDGTPSYNEGYLYQDGRMIRARAVQIPWLRRIVGAGDDVALVLESELGLTRIEGASLLSTFRVGNPELLGGLSIQQGGALYRWDGQSAYGMIERSSPPGLTNFGVATIG